MDWMNQIGGLLRQYVGGDAQRASGDTERHFDQVAKVAPRASLSEGLAEAFRSKQTPPFPQMLGQLFGNSAGPQRANILNTLIAAAGPSILSRLNLGNAADGGQGVTQQQADQVSPQAVEQIAHEAEKQYPTLIERVSDIYAEHPSLFKTLGTAALAVAMSKMAKQDRGLF